MGALGTAYLTVVKVLGGNAACPTAACDRVLASPYAQIFGVPLTIFGCLGYLAMAVLALAPFAINPDRQKDLRRRAESVTWPLLFIGATAMVVFSGYLMYLLAFELKAACLYCITSALFAITMFVMTVLGRPWDDAGQLVFRGIIVAMVTLISTLAIYAPINSPQAADSNIPGEAGPPVTTVSQAAELQLAQHLAEIDAKMYGAYWCPHCHDQKQLFGQEAAQTIPYIECAPDGQNPQTQLCQSVDEVRGFPTWEINGEFYSGAQPLQVLAEASGYSGPQDFTN